MSLIFCDVTGLRSRAVADAEVDVEEDGGEGEQARGWRGLAQLPVHPDLHPIQRTHRVSVCRGIIKV